jgi:large repetitive protein
MKKSLLFLILAILFVVNTSFVFATVNIYEYSDNVAGEVGEPVNLWIVAQDQTDPTLELAIEWDFDINNPGMERVDTDFSYYNDTYQIWFYTTSYVYDMPGTYQGRIYINGDVSGQIEINILPENLPPVVILEPQEIWIDVGGIVDFDATQTYDDNDPMQDLRFIWDSDGDGNFDIDGNGIATAQTTFNNNGTYEISLYVFDQDTIWIEGQEYPWPEWGMNTSIVHVNLPPVAEANGPYYSEFGVDIQFDSTGSYDPDGIIAVYEWDFDSDGTIDSFDEHPLYAYPVEGNYVAELCVEDDVGSRDCDTTDILVNLPPVAEANGPYDNEPGVNIQFDSTGSYDPDGTIVLYEWDFDNDGVVDSNDPNPVYAYGDSGDYTPELCVEDDYGARDCDTADSMINLPPVADANGPYYYEVNETFTLDSSASYDLDGTIVSYEWDLDGDGVVDSYLESPQIMYNTYGDFSVELCVEDDDSARDCDTAIISVNIGPVAEANGPYEARPEENIQFNSTGSYDLDGTLIAFYWDFDMDGTVDSTDENPEYDYDDEGNYTAQLCVEDDDGAQGCDTAEVSVVRNQAPVAEANGPYVYELNETVQLNSSGSFDEDGTIVSYEWYIDSDGFVDSYDENPLVNYGGAGEYDVELCVEDDEGARDCDTAVVLISEDLSNDPRRIIFIDGIRFMVDELEVEPGDELPIHVAIENIGSYDIKNIKISAAILEFGEYVPCTEFEFEMRNKESQIITLVIPEDAQPGWYDVRFTVSDDDVRRVKHRDFLVI